MKKTEKSKKPRVSAELRSAVSKLRTIAAEQEAAGIPNVDAEEDEPAASASSPDRRPTATAAIVGAAFEAAVSRDLRRRLMRCQALAVIVTVPDPTWVAPATAYAKAAYGSRWCMQLRDGKDRRSDAAVGSEDVARDLAQGFCVMGIAADAKLLPASLQSAADIAIRVAPPDGTVLLKAIARFTGRSPGKLDAGTAAGLDLHQLVATFRPGKGAKDIVARLDAARRSQGRVSDRLPALETAVEYGPAQVWGLDLVRDIAAFRAGRIAWRDVDRGICLHSAPGLGKSLFARIVAQAAGVPLVTTSVAEWFAAGPGYLDSVVKQMRGAFAKAAGLASPVCILFIDEIDALPNRATLSDRNRDWWMPVVTDALTLLDSAVSDRGGIVVIGATNAIGRVDDALLRPGRLERIVEVPRPDAAGALNILKFHLDGEIRDDLSRFGPLLDGSTGAEIMLVVRSARRAARNAGRPITVGDLENAVLPREAHPRARLFRMAVHEAAHAVATMALGAGKVDRVVLRLDGTSGGRTVVTNSDADLDTRATIEDRVTVALAARAAELRFTGAVSTGAGGTAGSDIGFATLHVAALHASLGMCGPPLFLAEMEDLPRALARDVGLRLLVARDLRRLERRAMRVVVANSDAISALAERLAEKRHLDGAEVERIVRGRMVKSTAPIRKRAGRNGGC